MQVKSNELAAYLKRTEQSPESGLIWIQGDEPILVEELAIQVRNSKKFTISSHTSNAESESESESESEKEDSHYGLHQRENIIANAQYDWSYISHATQQKSLFSEKRFFDVRLQTDKLTAAAIKVLEEYLTHWHTDNFILITSQRVDTKHSATKAFKALLKSMVYVPVWPLNTHEFTNWIKNKAHSAHLEFTPEALEFFVEQTEGNLLAAKQEIEKLKLAHITHITHKNRPFQIKVETLEVCMTYLAQANIFEVLEKAYAGKYKIIPKQLQQLKDEGQLPIMILAAITRDLDMLQNLHSAKNTVSFNDLCKRFRLFGTKRQNIKILLNRLDYHLLSTCNRLAYLIDKSIKGASKVNSWQLLDLLLLTLAGCTHPHIVTLAQHHFALENH